MSRTPLLFCPECGQKARITKTARTHKLLNYQYCSCSDPECGLTFRIKSEFDRVLSPSAKGLDRLNAYLASHGNNSQLAFDVVNPA
ncbi:ogr/Delta-like zinc finger family protein [Gilliamella sp. Occ4-3]|uniref:ogr/Delta-like zinc finger family protein n=1 Tax=Gilliamella sp. Occ4-3 TaxID=3120254 RepID=UPI00080EB3EB|nr:ogr/Delta-like zinc finger family protein [Gilliamella apicola]OCG79382.1 hypothetical protein A9G44_11660 [Gilliamella apicola]